MDSTVGHILGENAPVKKILDNQHNIFHCADGTQNVVIEFQAVIDTIQNQRLKSSMSPDAFERIGAISSIRGRKRNSWNGW